MLPADNRHRSGEQVLPLREVPDARPDPARRAPRHVLMTADAVGGVWRYALDLAAEILAHGGRVTIAAMGPSPSGAQRAEAERLGVALVDRPYRLEWMADPWQDLERAGRWLLALERRIEPDVVHLNGYYHSALPWVSPVVVVAHSCVRSWWRAVHGAEAPPEWDRYRRAVADGLAAASLVVAPTAAMLAALHEEYGLPAGARVIPNGSTLTACGQPAARAKEPLVLAAGRLWDEAKNIESLCEVASSISWPVAVAGEAREPGGTWRHFPSVTYLGRLASAEMSDWYGRAAIYALPARYEPFGLSVLEAAASGCALVLGDIRSLRENWTGTAVFVPPDNRRALAAAIERLIDDPARRQDLAGRARRRSAQFTVARMAEEYLRAYREVLELGA